MQSEQQPSSKGLTIGLSLIGAILGGSLRNDASGFVSGGVLGALIAQVLHLRNITRVLQGQLDALRAGPKESATRSAELAPTLQPAAAQATAPESIAPTEPPPAAAPDESARPAHVATQQRRRPSSAASPSRPRTPSLAERASAAALAWLKGGNPLARIGIAILFLGGTFLAKYAADNSLFPIELRFIALALGSLALLGIGWRLRERRAVYAQLLQGGGIAGFYLTVFAATKVVQLLPFGLAFGLMVAVALAAAILAVAQNALSLAVIGTTGGFLTPLLLSTGSGNHIALFSYYAILNLGIFAVAWYRTWRVLNVIGFVFTFTITALWRGSAYDVADRFSADAFLILFFLMYVGVSILNCVRQPPNLKGYVSGSLVFGLPVVAFALHASMVEGIEYAMAWSALGLAAFYLLLGWTLYRSGRDTFRLLVESFAALGVIFGSLAIPLAFDTRTTAAMWAVEGAGLLWLGIRQQRKLARAFGTLLQLAAGLGFLSAVDALAQARPVLNTACLGALMLAVSGMLSGYWLYRDRERAAPYEAGAHHVFAVWATAWWLFAGLHQIDAFLERTAFAAALSYIAVSTAVLTAVARSGRWPFPQRIALYLPAAALVLALAAAATFTHPAVDWNAVGWAALLFSHYAMLRIDEPAHTASQRWLHAVGYWVVALLIAWEASWQIGEYTAGVWPRLAWGIAPLMLLAWIARRKLTPQWPFATHRDAYVLYAAVPLVVALSLWIASINLTSSGDPAWLPYLPLFNPLDVSVALAFASIAMWWSVLQAEERALLWPWDRRALIAAAAALVFIWLNAALIRSLHHNFGAPITFFGAMSSTLVQAALSIFWGVLGFIAMTIAARQKWRYVWLVGAALMVVVVLKLFVVDLSSIGTVARIASFLSVGVLLLVTGYVAPLPPRRAGAAP